MRLHVRFEGVERTCVGHLDWIVKNRIGEGWNGLAFLNFVDQALVVALAGADEGGRESGRRVGRDIEGSEA